MLFRSKLKLKPLFLLPFAAIFLVTAGCDVTQEEPGEAPDVDVQVDEGEIPEYDVEGPEVDVGTEQEEITVPDVDVEPPE
jgi:hypothetical protein